MAEKESSKSKSKRDESESGRLKRRKEWWKKHRDDSGKSSTGPTPTKTKESVCVQTVDSNTEVNEEGQKKNRYILFIGNLPFSATVESVKEHFKSVGNVTDFRLMTKKSGGSKGCGFLELDGPAALAKALRFHHTVMCARKINVEVTCGGGGNSEARRAKVKFRNERKRKSRSKKVEAQRECAKGTEDFHEETDEGNHNIEDRDENECEPIVKVKKVNPDDVDEDQGNTDKTVKDDKRSKNVAVVETVTNKRDKTVKKRKKKSHSDHADHDTGTDSVDQNACRIKKARKRKKVANESPDED